MQRSTHKATWDRIWDKSDIESIRIGFEKEKVSQRWNTARTLVLKKHSTLKGLNVIEVGGGSGKYAALFGMHGANTTVMDLSDSAIDTARRFHESLNLKTKFLKANALKLDKGLIGRFDIAVSIGLVEHFIGPERKAILDSHFSLINKDGVAIISAPNKYCFPFTLYKGTMEAFKRYDIDLEIPYTLGEFRAYCMKTNKRILYLGGCSNFIGDSKNFMFRLSKELPVLRNIIGRISRKRNAARISGLRHKNFVFSPEKRTIFDNDLAYSLLLVAEKQASSSRP
jgi:2-polyprenyl-3-methyl-5-hydroxy-6-metoxy-1,4-benzoquinol methylase